MTLLDLCEELLKCIREGQLPPDAMVLSSRAIPIIKLNCDPRIKAVFLEEGEPPERRQ